MVLKMMLAVPLSASISLACVVSILNHLIWVDDQLRAGAHIHDTSLCAPLQVIDAMMKDTDHII